MVVGQRRFTIQFYILEKVSKVQSVSFLIENCISRNEEIENNFFLE